jgi:hypothetical protein
VTLLRASHPPIAYVEWLDSAVVVSGWEDREESLKRVDEMSRESIVSAGFLVANEPDHILVCAGLNTYRDDIAQCLSIPRTAIRKVVLWTGEGAP